jgi:hypothetical protein
MEGLRFHLKNSNFLTKAELGWADQISSDELGLSWRRFLLGVTGDATGLRVTSKLNVELDVPSSFSNSKVLLWSTVAAS